MERKFQRRLLYWEQREIERLLTEHTRIVDKYCVYDKDWDDYRVAREVGDQVTMGQVRHYRQAAKDREGNLIYGLLSPSVRGGRISENRERRFKTMMFDVERLRARVAELEQRMAMVEKVLTDNNAAPEFMLPQPVRTTSL